MANLKYNNKKRESFNDKVPMVGKKPQIKVLNKYWAKIGRAVLRILETAIE